MYDLFTVMYSFNQIFLIYHGKGNSQAKIPQHYPSYRDFLFYDHKYLSVVRLKEVCVL